MPAGRPRPAHPASFPYRYQWRHRVRALAPDGPKRTRNSPRRAGAVRKSRVTCAAATVPRLSLVLALPACLLEHLAVLVLAHLLAPLLDDRAHALLLLIQRATPEHTTTPIRPKRHRGALRQQRASIAWHQAKDETPRRASVLTLDTPVLESTPEPDRSNMHQADGLRLINRSGLFCHREDAFS
jgi:hypothetical protein